MNRDQFDNSLICTQNFSVFKPLVLCKRNTTLVGSLKQIAYNSVKQIFTFKNLIILGEKY